MARFLARYMGSAANEKRPDAAKEEVGVAAWGQWMQDHQASIIDQGAPLGKTLKVDRAASRPAKT